MQRSLLVKRDCAARLADIDQCAQEVMKSVAAYKGVQDQNSCNRERKKLTEQDIKELEQVLNFYTTISYEKLFRTESIPRLLLSKRLVAVKKMKQSGLLEQCSFMKLLKVNCIHIVLECFLVEYGMATSDFTLNKIEIYQYQDIDVTEDRAIDTLEGASGLIWNAVFNYTLVKNLAATREGVVDADEIKHKINQKFTKVLVKNHGIGRCNMGTIYGIPVNEDTSIASNEEKILIVHYLNGSA